MLTSLDLNGCVPEAIVTVVTFGLEPEDYEVLRAGAGRLAPALRFLEVDAAMLAGIDTSRWPKVYPPPVLGRLFLPASIDVPGARLITIDSDMIVNVSLRPLFELDLGTDYVAACHDVPRTSDPDYFNSGLMLIDVDAYRHFDIAARCMAWLAGDGAESQWPDQDALNLMVGDLWYRLDYRWNMHCSPWRALIPEDYEQAFIAHYAASKPWNDLRHIGRGLYVRYLDLFRRRLEIHRQLAQQADAAFVITAHEALLGCEPTAAEVGELRNLPADEVVRRLVGSVRFAATTLLSLRTGAAFASGTFTSRLALRHRLWAAERLPVTAASARTLVQAEDWRELLQALLDDLRFVRVVNLAPRTELVDALKRGMETAQSRHPA